MMKLVVEDEAGTRTVAPFTGDEIIVGRGAQDAGLRLADRDVSRRHARFLNVNGVIFVEDLGSLTGTRVNGDRISARRRLREGDLIEIAGYDLAVVPDEGLLPAVAGPGAPPPLPSPAPAPAPPVRAAPPPPSAAKPVAPTPVPAPPSPARAPSPGPGTALPSAPRSWGEGPRPLLVVLACLAVLLLGAAAGYAVGLVTY